MPGFGRTRPAHFTQPDSIVPGAGDALAWDRYVYVIKHVDPSGNCPVPGFGDFRENNKNDSIFYHAGNTQIKCKLDSPLGELIRKNNELKSFFVNNNERESSKSGEEIPGWAQEILEFFQDHPLIWKSASQSVKDLFFVKGGQNGTRLFMLDYHMLQNSSGNVWHINSDLKALQGLNHQDLTPYLYYTSQILSTISNMMDPLIIIFYTPLDLPYPETRDT